MVEKFTHLAERQTNAVLQQLQSLKSVAENANQVAHRYIAVGFDRDGQFQNKFIRAEVERFAQWQLSYCTIVRLHSLQLSVCLSVKKKVSGCGSSRGGATAQDYRRQQQQSNTVETLSVSQFWQDFAYIIYGLGDDDCIRYILWRSNYEHFSFSMAEIC